MAQRDELDVALRKLEYEVATVTRLWDEANESKWDQYKEATTRVVEARAAIHRLFAQRVTLRTAEPRDLGVAIPQSAILEAGRPKPLKVDP